MFLQFIQVYIFKKLNEIYIIWIYLIKPENILFDENNKIKLIDYGFSFCYKNTDVKYFGTPSYTMHKREKYNPELVLKKIIKNDFLSPQ